MMRCDEACHGWPGEQRTQVSAALFLGHCERSLRRHVERYQVDGLDGLPDKRPSPVSKRRGKHRIERERAPLTGKMLQRRTPAGTTLGRRGGAGTGRHQGRRQRGTNGHVLLPSGAHGVELPRDADSEQVPCAEVSDFGLHAAVRCGADERQTLERLEER